MTIPLADQRIEPIFTCRVWLKEAVRRLAHYNFINCPNVYVLEQELMRYGMQQDGMTVSGSGWALHIARSSV